MAEGQLAPEIQKQEAPRFTRYEKSSSDLFAKVDRKYNDKEIPPEQKLSPSVYINTGALKEKGVDIPENTNLEDLLKIAKDKGLRISLYAGGIAWDGNLTTQREATDMPGFKPTHEGKAKAILRTLAAKVNAVPSEKIRAILIRLAEKSDIIDVIQKQLSPEERLEMKGKLPALDFLAASGTDICITLDPPAKKPFLSSLRADATAKGATYETLLAAGVTPESVNWSNGGFKEFQIHRAACDAIASRIQLAMNKGLLSPGDCEDICKSGRYEDLLQRIDEGLNSKDKIESGKNKRDEVFNSASEAYKYLSRLKGMNIFLGGTPTGAVDLASPFSLVQSTPILDKINRGLMRATNKMVEALGKIDASVNFSNLKVTRLAEMGRGYEFDETIKFSAQWFLIEKIMQNAVSDMRIIILADRSGRVVASDPMTAAKNLQAIYGKDKAIAVETRDEQPLAIEVQSKDNKSEMIDVTGDSQHGELKRIGVLSKLRQMADSIRANTFDNEASKKRRYAIVENPNVFTLTKELIHVYTSSS